MNVIAKLKNRKTQKKNRKIELLLHEAKKCAQNKLYHSMLICFDKILEIEFYPQILIQKINTLIFLQEYENALIVINEALKIHACPEFFMSKSYILGALQKFDEAIEAIDNAISMSNEALYHALKGLIYLLSGKLEHAIDCFMWIQQNLNILENIFDFHFLSIVVDASTMFNIDFSQLNQNLFELMRNSSENDRSKYIKLMVEIDLFRSLKSHVTDEFIDNVTSLQSVNNADKIQFLCSVEKWDLAEKLLHRNIDKLDRLFFSFYQARINLHLGTLTSEMLIKNFVEWDKETSYAFIMLLWRRKEFHFLKDIFSNYDYDSAVINWMKFWLEMFFEDYVAAENILLKLPQGLEVFISENRKLNSMERDIFGDIVSLFDLKSNLSLISDLFPVDLPYDKMSWSMFIVFVKKIFPSQYSYLIDHQVKQTEQLKYNDDAIINNENFRDYYISNTMKTELINTLSQILLMGEASSFAVSLLIVIGASRSIHTKLNKIIESSRDEERNKIMSDLSHNIKNLLRSVIDPLESLKREMPDKNTIIEDAIKGAQLIREMVNSINFSYTVSIDDLLYDIKNIDIEATSVKKMILQSYKNAVSNMFDSVYYPQFMSNYFKNRDAFSTAKEDWREASLNNDLGQLLNFTNKHMFNGTIDIEQSSDLIVGNERSSAIKLNILLQEIILNAVKYVSFVPFVDRKLNILFAVEPHLITMVISNSFNPNIKAKTTGLGNTIINNFSKVLDCDINVEQSSEVYTVTMSLKNYWR